MRTGILKTLIACVLYFLVFCDKAVVIKRERLHSSCKITVVTVIINL